MQLLLHKFKIIKPPNMLKLNHYTTLQTRRFQDISLKTNRKGARDRDHTRAFKCVTIFTGLFYSTHWVPGSTFNSILTHCLRPMKSSKKMCTCIVMANWRCKYRLEKVFNPRKSVLIVPNLNNYEIACCQTLKKSNTVMYFIC